ncbi:MAG TPA: PadR family transcriptional regulator [Microthrixaceae bacterium]|nr:PadR family transcriptional regulator [Microthrixaceae bacterium]
MLKLTMLDLAISGLLVEGDLHGYELKKRLAELLGSWSSVSFGSLYPALRRLERGGYVATVEDVDAATPMSGSLGAELAAFRRDPARRARASTGRRARKVYTLTEAGHAQLTHDLGDPNGDEKSFAIRVAFCRLLPPDQRLELFRRRRDLVAAGLAGRVERDARADQYRRSLFEFQDDRLHRELAWVDQLIASAETESPTDHLTPGGSPS